PDRHRVVPALAIARVAVRRPAARAASIVHSAAATGGLRKAPPAQIAGLVATAKARLPAASSVAADSTVLLHSVQTREKKGQGPRSSVPAVPSSAGLVVIA